MTLSINVNPTGNFSLATFSGDAEDDEIIYFDPDYIDQLLQANQLSANSSEPVACSLLTFFTRVGTTEFLSTDSSDDIVHTYPISASNNKGIAYYPMDSYDTTIYVSMYLQFVGVNTTDGIAQAKAPFSIQIQNLVAGWNSVPSAAFSRNRAGNKYSNSVQMQFSIERYGVIKGLSVFVVVMMWLISLAVFVMASDTYFNQPILRDLNPTSAAIANSLLFGLPALRLVQPGIPSLNGAPYLLVDVTGFYINMALVAVSSVLMISKLCWLYQPKAANVVHMRET